MAPKPRQSKSATSKRGAKIFASLLVLLAGTTSGALASVYDDGVSVMNKGDLQGAVALFNQAVTNNEQDWKPFLKRGQCLYQMAAFQLAVDDFTQVCQLNKINADGFFWRANAYSKLGKYSLAASDYAEVQKLEPTYIADHSISPMAGVASATNGGGLSATSSSSVGSGQTTGSSGTNIGTTSAAAPSKKPVLLTLRSKTFGVDKDPENQISQLTEAITLDPLNSKLLFKRARAYIQTTRFTSAMEDLNNAIQSEPNNASYYLARAYVYHKQGQDVMGKEDINKALFVDPGLPSRIEFGDD